MKTPVIRARLLIESNTVGAGLAVAVRGCYTSGYAAGTTGARGRFTQLVLPLLLAVLITLIADLDNPRSGLSQQPLLDLRESIAPGK